MSQKIFIYLTSSTLCKADLARFNNDTVKIDIALVQNVTSDDWTNSYPGKIVQYGAYSTFFRSRNNEFTIQLHSARRIHQVVMIAYYDPNDKPVLQTDIGLYESVLTEIQNRGHYLWSLESQIVKALKIIEPKNPYLLIYSIHIYKTVFKNPKYVNIEGHAKVIAASHPFNLPTKLSEFIKHSSYPKYIVFYTGTSSPMNYEVFDNSPMAWYTVFYTNKMLFTELIVTTLNSKCSPDLHISFHADKDRKPTVYKENGTTKIFVGSCENKKAEAYTFENPFIASYVNVNLLYSQPRLHFILLLNGYKSILPISDDVFIHSKYKHLDYGNIDSYIEIDLAGETLVSGIGFDSIHTVKRFCIKYMLRNNEYVYRDDLLHNDTTKFSNIVQNISLRSFVADKIMIDCIKGTTSSSLVVNVKGRQNNLEAYHWSYRESKIDGHDDLSIFHDKYGGEPLYGTMENLHKHLPEDRLRTNYLGPDCLTRPHLCDIGFSMKFQMIGKFHSPHTDGYTMSPSLWSLGAGAYNWLRFDYPLRYMYAEIVHCTLHLKTNYKAGSAVNSYTYILFNGAYESPNVYQQSAIKVDTKLEIEKEHKIDLTDLLTKSLKSSDDLIQHLAIVFIPRTPTSSMIHELINQESVKLQILTRLKVPKTIKLLKRKPVEGNSNYRHYIVALDGKSIITGIRFTYDRVLTNFIIYAGIGCDDQPVDWPSDWFDNLKEAKLNEPQYIEFPTPLVGREICIKPSYNSHSSNKYTQTFELFGYQIDA